MAWNSTAINQSLNGCKPNTHKAILLYLDIIKHMLSDLFDALGYMSTTLTNRFLFGQDKCARVLTYQKCDETLK